MINPIPATLDFKGQKINGSILKMNPTGCLIEVDLIPFRVGMTLMIEFRIPDTNEVVIEEMRAIKSYDRFFRNPPKKSKTNTPEEGQEAPQPKKLSELHFLKIKETTRQAIMKHLMSLQLDSLKKTK